MANEAENAIYTGLSSAPLYHPSGTELFVGDWALEPGDVVTVKSGTDSYTVPIFDMEFTWNGGHENKVHLESPGNQEREPLPALQRKQYGAEYAAYQGKKNADTIYLNGQVIVQPGHWTGEVSLWSPEINCDYFYIGMNGSVNGEFGCDVEARFYQPLFAEHSLYVGDVEGDGGMTVDSRGNLFAMSGQFNALGVDDNGTMRTATWQSELIVTGVTTSLQNPRIVMTESTSANPSDIAANLVSTPMDTKTIYFLGR